MPKRKNNNPKLKLSKRAKSVIFFVSLFVVLFGFIQTGFYTNNSIPIEEGQPPTLLATKCRDDFCLNLVESIRKAEHSVNVMIFTMTDPAVIQALKEKAESGVKVTVVYDAANSSCISKRLGPDVKVIPREKIKGLMHRKIVVIDDNLVWLGSANFTTGSLKHNDNLMIGVQSPAIATVINSKFDCISKRKPSVSTPPHDFIIGGQHVELWFLPEDKEALQRLSQLLQGAQKTMKVAMYTWTHSALTQEVINAHRRGVNVTAIMDRQMSRVTNAAAVNKLLANGIPVSYNCGPQVFHHKMAYIDDQLLIMGSANWTKSAFEKNEDCFVVLHELTEQQKERIERVWDMIEKESKSAEDETEAETG